MKFAIMFVNYLHFRLILVFWFGGLFWDLRFRSGFRDLTMKLVIEITNMFPLRSTIYDNFVK